MNEVYRSQPVKLSLAEQGRTLYLNRRDNFRLARLGVRAAQQSRPQPGLKPVIFFNASTRLVGLSQNAVFSLLTALGLQQAGVPVVHFGCRAGMSRCVLGTVRASPETPPPCTKCIAQSERLYGHAPVVWFRHDPDAHLAQALENLDVKALAQFEYPFGETNIPLGKLVVHSLRWALRLYDLEDDLPTRFFLRQYILSAYHLANEFAHLIERLEPQALVIFNGILYPEATARWVGETLGQRVITYEVAYEPFSVFFSDGLATRYPIDIPKTFELNQQQNQLLDHYLAQRFKGNFSMAGIQFWPEIQGLEPELQEKMAAFRQVVPVFTNVIYDTSQVGTQVAFQHMFDWLDHLLPLMRSHPETLFVIRAHPDEKRPGKESRQSVANWVAEKQVGELPNVHFIDSRQFVSSYELIQRARFVLVYNSSIGLEATLLGTPVVCAATARYTQYPIVYFPQTKTEYENRVRQMLDSETVDLPAEFAQNARRFLYYQLFRASLPFGDFMQNSLRPGFVHLKKFPLEALHPDQCPTIRVILDALYQQTPFLMPVEEPENVIQN
jgi:hypothetical protein